MVYTIPSPVTDILKKLESNGYEAFIVGGCVRDLILSRKPKDWDITTNAEPEEILRVFPDSFYENEFGTVGVKVERFGTSSETIIAEDATQATKEEKDIVEVTTYRSESGYTDSRHPDKVIFVSSLEEDLSRRDFTMNAIAAKVITNNQNPTIDGVEIKTIDPFGGKADIEKRIIRAVGSPDKRFGEDALRMIRAVRFRSELSGKTVQWGIDPETLSAITLAAKTIERVSWERIRDEFSKIILSDAPEKGIETLHETGLLRYILPELEEGIGVGQNLHHVYTVWEHNLRALSTCPSKKLEVRLAALLHDVAKPRTKRGNGYRSTFYNHDHVGARMTRSILTRLRYPKEIIEKASLLVDNHLFYYNVGEVTEASVRRLIKRVGLENMDDLMAVRIGDRLGSGVPKAKPYKLRHLEYMIEKVSSDPISVKMLAIDGTTLIETLGIVPGPKIGAILDILLSEVIEDPKKNVRETLISRSEELASEEFSELRKHAKKAIEGKREEEDRKIKKTHWVE